MPRNLPSTFTKEDYLTPIKVAQKFHASRELVEKLMESHFLKKTTFPYGTGRRILVIDARYSHHRNISNLRLHPAGTKIFEELLNKAQSKEK